MPDLMELAERYAEHGVQLAPAANNPRWVTPEVAETAAHCFTIAAALRARASEEGEGR